MEDKIGFDAFDELLIGDDPALESEILDMKLTSEDEAVVFLQALEASCESNEEFVTMLKDNGVDMAMYGLVPNVEVCESLIAKILAGDSDEEFTEEEDAAMEGSTRVIRVNNFKQANFSRIEKRTALRLAERANDNLFEKYAKYRKLMIDARIAIYRKYLRKATTETKAILKAKRMGASAMSTPGGKSIEKRMDSTIQNLDRNARNREAIKK